MERKIVYWNRPLRVKLVAPRNSKKGLEFWGLIVTAILSAVSAIVSAWGASETAKQAKIAQEQLNRGNINSSYEGYITSLGEYCRKLDVTRGEYEYVVVQTEDKRLQVSVVPLLHPARELSLYSDIPDPTTVDQANLIRALESTRLWIPDKFPHLSLLTIEVVKVANLKFNQSEYLRERLISYSYCRHMQDVAIEWFDSHHDFVIPNWEMVQLKLPKGPESDRVD